MKNAQLEAIATLLGATFTDPHEMGDRGHITMPDGLKIFAQMVGRTGSPGAKINFSVSWPEHIANKDLSTRSTSQRDFRKDNGYWDGINVGATKPADQIAKDVQRRFLPVAEPLWAECLEFCARQERAYTGQKSNELLARELFTYDSKKVCGTLEYAGSDYMNITVNNLNQDQARKLAAFLKTL